MLLRPDTILENGSYVNFINKSTKKNETWLITFYESHILYPKSYVRYCNKILKYKKNDYPCVITSKINLSSDIEENKELVLPKGYLLALVKATEETLQTQEGQRFLIDDNAYEVQTIDTISNIENKIGVVEMNLKQVPKNYEENIETNKKENVDIAEKHTLDNIENNANWKW